MERRKGGYRTPVSKQNCIWGRGNLVTNGILLLLISQDDRCHFFPQILQNNSTRLSPKLSIKIYTFLLWCQWHTGLEQISRIWEFSKVRLKCNVKLVGTRIKLAVCLHHPRVSQRMTVKS